MTEILLGVKPFLQPSPGRNPGGDCFACSLKAATDYLYPENPIDFNLAWESFEETSVGGNRVLSNCWPTMAWRAPYALHEHGYKFDLHRDLLMPQPDLDHHSYSWGFQVNEQEWSLRLHAWLSAGWVAIAEQSFPPLPAVTPDGRKNHTDHFVVLDGQRSFWQESSLLPGASSLEHETHVVCSAKGAYWIDTKDLLNLHGVNALVLLRRSNYPRRPFSG